MCSLHKNVKTVSLDVPSPFMLFKFCFEDDLELFDWSNITNFQRPFSK